jgi:hypothetical protein
MGWKDRLARVVARLFVTAPDHPGSGGVTGETETDDPPEEPADGSDREDAR